MGLQISASGILNAIQRQRVAANNIANLRTPGFRAGRADSTETAGGGVRLGGVTQNNAPGAIEFTGRATDFAVADGFFRVELEDGSFAFTRDGSFGLNANGEVVAANGARLSPPIQVPANASSVTVSRTGAVFATVPGALQPQQAGQIAVFDFANAGGLEALGENLFRAAAASGPAQPAATAALEQGHLNGSNVNLAAEQANLLLDTRAAQANLGAFRVQEETLGDLLDILR